MESQAIFFLMFRNPKHTLRLIYSRYLFGLKQFFLGGERGVFLGLNLMSFGNEVYSN